MGKPLERMNYAEVSLQCPTKKAARLREPAGRLGCFQTEAVVSPPTSD